ncbi:TPA: caspase family protein [Legionella pneumophila]
MRKALVIGVDNYPSSPLRGCVNDAAAIAGVLEEQMVTDRQTLMYG